MATRKISIKNYEKAQYKTELTAFEYNDIISMTIEGIIKLYDKGIYGFNQFTFNSSLVSVCTNINIDKQDVDGKIKLFEETDVIQKIIDSIGNNVYDRIQVEIDLGLKYRISTNPETKQLLRELTTFVRSLAKNTEFISEDSMKSIAEVVLGVIGGEPKNEDNRQSLTE